MTTVAEARTALVEALDTVEGLRVYDDPGATIDPQAAVVSLPDLQWQGQTSDPTGATFSIALVVKLNDHAMGALEALVAAAAAAVDTIDDAAVTAALVGTWRDQLPAYDLEVEYAL